MGDSMKRLCVLGVTGSIGLNVCDIVKQNRKDFEIVGVALNVNVKTLFDILKEHPTINYVYVSDISSKQEILQKYPELIVFTKEESMLSLIDAFDYDLIVNALVGFAGLEPTIHSLTKGIDVALANKESLVIGGGLIKNILSSSDVKLYPIDSEHVALSKCLKHKKIEDINRLILTASGGPFRNNTRDELKNVTVEQALKHPSWKMGAKITIDSATMINKGFEIIEAYYLFDIPVDKIDVLLHDESVIHSMIELVDNSFLADLGPADMRIPISYALYEGSYHSIDKISKLKLEDLGTLHFRKYDSNRYPGVELAKRAIKEGGSMPCVLNAANEAVNLAFREKKISFLQIEEIIEKVMNMHKIVINPSLDDLIKIHYWAYELAQSIIEKGE